MAVTDSSVPKRPIILSADHRKISYTSKTGKTVTLQLRNSGKAVESLRELSDRDTKTLEADLEQSPSENDSSADSQGVWANVYDTLSFWVMEAVEVAAFGPYDEPR